MGIKVDRIILRHIRMPLVHFFETSFGRTFDRDIVLVEAVRRRLRLGRSHGRRKSFLQRGMDRLRLAFAHRLHCAAHSEHEFADASEVNARTEHIRGHNMTRGGVETAIWDLQARSKTSRCGRPSAQGASEIACGVSIGIQDSVEQLLEKIETELAAGYQRIKMKIKPGWDVDVIRQVRETFPAHQADGRRQLSLYAGRYRSFEEAGRFLSDDD